MRYYRTKKKIETWTWLRCYYVWKVDNIIVLYEGTILEDLWDTVKCKMMYRDVKTSNDFFEITLTKKSIKINNF